MLEFFKLKERNTTISRKIRVTTFLTMVYALAIVPSLLKESLQSAIAVGIGLFITLIAFSNAGIASNLAMQAKEFLLLSQLSPCLLLMIS